MKITPQDFAILETAVNKARSKVNTLSEYIQQGLTAKRWRWDLLWAAKRAGYLPERFIEDSLYSYCDDSHIDTALRWMLTELGVALRAPRKISPEKMTME